MGQSSQVASSYAYFTITIFSVCHGGKKFGKYFTRLSVPCQQGPCLTHVPDLQLVTDMLVAEHGSTDDGKRL